MLTVTRYLTMMLNLLLAIALLVICVVTMASGVRHPETAFGLCWMAGFAFIALKSAFYLFQPRRFEEGLKWHKRIVILWGLTAGVYATLATTSTLRGNTGCATGMPNWFDLASFAVAAVLWAAPGWVTAVLCRRLPRL